MDEGFAVRFVDRAGRSWMACRDELSKEELLSALTEVARTQPAVPLLLEDWQPSEPPPLDPELLLQMRRFAPAVQQRVEDRRLGFRFALDLVWHHRLGTVLGSQLPPADFEESFFSAELRTQSGTSGLLLPRLDTAAEEEVANRAVASFLARASGSPESGCYDLVLGPDAAAVLMHEIAAHGLEVDLLSLTGNPAAAVGLELGTGNLDLIDDPSRAPAEVRRENDDEGLPVSRRFLLRGGVVEQPLCDRVGAMRFSRVVPGAGRRGDRRLPPLPRSHHLELMTGETSFEELLTQASEGIYCSTVSGGSLDPIEGSFVLHLPWGRKIQAGSLASRVGSFRIEGTIVDLLSSIALIGNESRSCGAGWCAKGGQRLPVWATMPPILLRGVTVEPEGDSA